MSGDPFVARLTCTTHWLCACLTRTTHWLCACLTRTTHWLCACLTRTTHTLCACRRLRRARLHRKVKHEDDFVQRTDSHTHLLCHDGSSPRSRRLRNQTSHCATWRLGRHDARGRSRAYSAGPAIPAPRAPISMGAS